MRCRTSEGFYRKGPARVISMKRRPCAYAEVAQSPQCSKRQRCTPGFPPDRVKYCPGETLSKRGKPERKIPPAGHPVACDQRPASDRCCSRNAEASRGPPSRTYSGEL